MKVLYEIKDMLEDELKKISKKEDITAMDLENIYKMVDIVKDITTVDAMHKAEQEGYSRDYSRGYSEDYANNYGYRSNDGRRGRGGDADGRYSEDNSYRRGRDSMGRYTSRDGSYRGGSYEGGYSGHANEEIIEHLKEMMRNARSEEERESYRKTIEQMQRA